MLLARLSTTSIPQAKKLKNLNMKDHGKISTEMEKVNSSTTQETAMKDKSKIT